MIETSEIKNWSHQYICAHCQQPYILTPYTINYVNLKGSTRFNPDWQYVANCTSCGWRNILSSVPSNIAVFVQFRK